MTLYIYKNEYLTAFVEQLRNNKIDGIVSIDETRRILVLEGEECTLEKVMGLMYETDVTVIKSAFESFKTVEDMKEDVENVKKSIHEEVLTKLCEICTKYSGTGISLREDAEFERLYKVYQLLEA